MEITKLDCAQWQEIGKEIRPASDCKTVTKYWDLYVRLYGADAWALTVGNQPVSFAAVQFNKRPKGEWGKYINSYLVYTLPEFRRQGLAVQLHQHIEQEAIRLGYRRTKSLIQTYGGFRFHLRLGHVFWGRIWRQGAPSEIRCDSPIVPYTPPSGVPPEALDAKDAHPLSMAELIEILQSPFYQMPKEDKSRLLKMPLSYDPKRFRPKAVLF